jgi:general secretion pathway protein J
MTMPQLKQAEERLAEAGFTLVELLVAFTLFALLSVLLLSGLRLGIESWQRGGKHEARLEDVLHAQTLLRRLIDVAYPRFIDAPGGNGYVDFSGGGQTLTFLSEGPLSLDQGGRFQFTLSAVEQDGQTNLVLTARPELAAGDSDQVSARRSVLTNIDSLAFAYYGRRRAEADVQWHSDWTKERELPLLVRLQLRFRAGDRGVWPDLVIHPRIDTDVSCIYDRLEKRCRGR